MLTKQTWVRTRCSQVGSQRGTSVLHSDDTSRRISLFVPTRSVAHTCTVRLVHHWLRLLRTRYVLLIVCTTVCLNKKHLKNVGPIHYCEPPHAHSPGVASGTVARRLCIDVYDADDDNAWQRWPLWPHGMGPMTDNNAYICIVGFELLLLNTAYVVPPQGELVARRTTILSQVSATLVLNWSIY